MIPTIYYYQKRNMRRFVLFYLAFLIIGSMVYLGLMTYLNEFSTLLTVDKENMFDELFRYPFGPIGYYALGIMIAIFYFEFSQSISSRELRHRRTYRLMKYIGYSHTRCLKCQLLGLSFVLFVVFIRYTSFGNLSRKNVSPQAVDLEDWPIIINALFNALAHYVFIIGFIMIFIPVFIGRLSVVRDIYSAQFFRPFARTNMTLACFQGLLLLIIFFSQ